MCARQIGGNKDTHTHTHTYIDTIFSAYIFIISDTCEAVGVVQVHSGTTFENWLYNLPVDTYIIGASAYQLWAGFDIMQVCEMGVPEQKFCSNVTMT